MIGCPKHMQCITISPVVQIRFYFICSLPKLVSSSFPCFRFALFQFPFQAQFNSFTFVCLLSQSIGIVSINFTFARADANLEQAEEAETLQISQRT